MNDSFTIPAGFRALVMTPPARVNSSLMPLLQHYIKQMNLSDFDGHRIIHMHQVEEIDSSAVVALLDIIRVAALHGRQFLMCDPPPIVRSYLEIYGLSKVVEGRILSSADDGTYRTDAVEFAPPFVPCQAGRLDIYANGKVRSYKFGVRELEEIGAVDLRGHPPKAPTRASTMEVSHGNKHQAMKATGYVRVRKHNCGCDATHSTFDKLHQLHTWLRSKGFDFTNIELWVSDVPAGMIAERMTFRDRMHFDQFQTLLKVDSGWRQIEAPVDHTEEEFYYVY